MSSKICIKWWGEYDKAKSSNNNTSHLCLFSWMHSAPCLWKVRNLVMSFADIWGKKTLSFSLLYPLQTITYCIFLKANLNSTRYAVTMFERRFICIPYLLYCVSACMGSLRHNIKEAHSLLVLKNNNGKLLLYYVCLHLPR